MFWNLGDQLLKIWRPIVSPFLIDVGFQLFNSSSSLMLLTFIVSQFSMGDNSELQASYLSIWTLSLRSHAAVMPYVHGVWHCLAEISKAFPDKYNVYALQHIFVYTCALMHTITNAGFLTVHQ